MEESLNTAPISSNKEKQHPVQKIEIKLDRKKYAGLTVTQLEELRESLYLYWNSLCHSLELGMSLNVMVRFRNNPKTGQESLPSISISLEGCDLDLPIWFEMQDVVSFGEVKGKLMEFICLSRESLLKPEYTKELYDRWDCKSKFSLEEFRTLVLLRVRHGFGLNTLYSAEERNNYFNIHSLFEHILEGNDTPSLTLILSSSVKPRMRKKISEDFSQMVMRSFSYQMGIPFPNFKVCTDKDLGAGLYQFQINALKWPPENGDPMEKRLPILDFLKSQAACFIHLSAVEHSLARLKESHPELVSMVFRKLDLPYFIQLLRKLTWERIPVRNLAYILENLLEEDRKIIVNQPCNFHLIPYQWSACHVISNHAYKENDPFIIKESIRSRLSREVFNSFKSTHGTLEVFTLTEELEGMMFEISPDINASLREHLAFEIIRFDPKRTNYLLLVSPELRFFLQDALAPKLPALHVLSFQEIPQNGQIVVLARINAPAQNT